jgi:hypothetical protein
MTRAAIVTLGLGVGLMLVGCRPPAPPVAETQTQQPEQRTPAPAQAVAVVDVDQIGATERVAVGHVGSTTEVVPPGVGATATACEQSCGIVHDCVLQERTYTPAAAASIELGCVRTCLSTAERATLFGCVTPSAIEPGACGQFLTCVDLAWPGDGDEGGIVTSGIDPRGSDPCARVCDVFARCWNPATKPEEIEQCAEQCRRDLDDEEERSFERCADLPECADVMTCVAKTPKAT